jgi:hypothetical protein
VGNKIRELFSRKRRYYESAIRDAIAEGSIEAGDPAEKATALSGLIEGILTQARIMNDPGSCGPCPNSRCASSAQSLRPYPPTRIPDFQSAHVVRVRSFSPKD